MRIISGIAKGRKLFEFKSPQIRPTSDMLRETLFNVLGHNMEGYSLLDLFAGTGAVGIEALSRGANKVVFVDRTSEAVNLIRRNLEHCQLLPSSQIIQDDFRKAIKSLEKIKEKFDFIFIDPPYHENLYEPCLDAIYEADLLKTPGIIIIEHFFKTKIPFRSEILTLVKEIRSGESMLNFYKK